MGEEEKPPATMLDPGGHAGDVAVADVSSGSEVVESTSVSSVVRERRQ